MVKAIAPQSYLMSYSGTSLFSGKVLPRFRRFLPGLRAIRTPQDGEEMGHLVTGNPLVPPFPRHPPTPLQFEIKGALPSDIHDTALSLHCARIAQELLPPLSSHYPLLNPCDIKLTGQHPIAAGGFVDVWEATYDGRRVVLKSYRCYVSFDVTRTVTVCCGLLQQVRR